MLNVPVGHMVTQPPIPVAADFDGVALVLTYLYSNQAFSAISDKVTLQTVIPLLLLG